MSELARHLNSPIIECTCGCGERFHSISIHGDELKYVKGHQNKITLGHNCAMRDKYRTGEYKHSSRKPKSKQTLNNESQKVSVDYKGDDIHKYK